MMILSDADRNDVIVSTSSCKRPVTDSFNKAKVSTVYVPTETSDTSLVRDFVCESFD